MHEKKPPMCPKCRKSPVDQMHGHGQLCEFCGVLDTDWHRSMRARFDKLLKRARQAPRTPGLSAIMRDVERLQKTVSLTRFYRRQHTHQLYERDVARLGERLTDAIRRHSQSN